MRQMTLATNGFEKHRKQTRKAEFLSRMDKLVPWAELCAVIEPFYPKAGTNKRARRNQPLSDADKETNRRKSQVRAKVEHPFRPFKNLFGFAKARYRGLMKNANRAFALLSLINIGKRGRPLSGVVRPA
jgi:IS5 family transposase